MLKEDGIFFSSKSAETSRIIKIPRDRRLLQVFAVCCQVLPELFARHKNNLNQSNKKENSEEQNET